MLSDTLKTTEVDRDRLLYLIGRFLGLFPENSFEQFKYVFEDDNDIQKLLASVYNDLNKCGAVYAVEGDKIKWNEKFDVNTYLENKKRLKASKAVEAQSRAKVKGAVRKFIVPGQVIENSGLTVKVKSVDIDLLVITTTIQKVADEWIQVFKPGFDAVWNYNNAFDDLYLFEATAQLESGNNSQNLLALENGKISFDRDS